MRKLKINWSDLELGSDTGFSSISHFLDLETGEVLMVSDEDRDYLEDPIDSLQDWEKEAAERARAVEEGYGERYIRVPGQDSREGYRDMEHFIGTVASPRLGDRLERAIAGRGAFRRFRDVLAEQPKEETRWYAYKELRLQQRMLDWLESIDVEPINPPKPVEVPESEPSESSESFFEELTLLVLYLASWEEQGPGGSLRRAWKGHVFETLDRLQDRGLINQRRRSKSVTLTQEGIALAQELEERYSDID